MKILLLAQGCWCHPAIAQLLSDSSLDICATIGDDYVATFCTRIKWKQIPNTRLLSDKVIAAHVNYYSPDIILSIQYPHLIGVDIISMMDGNIYNIHNAKLPDYRGHNCISHEILNEETEHFTTLHRISGEFDRGYLIDEQSLLIRDNDTAFSIWQRSQNSLMKIVSRIGPHIVMSKGRLIGKSGIFYSRFLDPKLKQISIHASIEKKKKVARAFWFPPHQPACEIDDEGNSRILCL